MRPIRYFIELDSEGQLLNPEPYDTSDSNERALRRGKLYPVPDVARAVGIRSLLLADKADYTLGYAGEGSNPGRVAAVHEAYLDQLERCAESTGEADVRAVLAFLRGSPLEQLDLDPEKFDPSALITFRIDGSRLPTELESVQAFWAAENTDADAPVMQCIVCGQERPVLGRLQGKIKGIPGGQVAGTSIISANAEAFESYGLGASLIAPTCAVCGEKFTKAANNLLRSEANRLVVGNIATIIWTRKEIGFDFLTYLNDPRPEQVRDLRLTLLRGGYPPEVKETEFYPISLSASGGRSVVRDWIDTTVEEAIERLAEWFRLQSIVGPSGEEARPLGLRDLATATVLQPGDVPTPTSRSLLRSALAGTQPPRDLLYRAVRRNVAEQGVDPRSEERRVGYRHKRVALIKLVLASHYKWEGDYMVRLDMENTDLAYRCGRLLAVLEEAQTSAIRGLNATIVDRFYGTASTAPASVFGRLLSGAQDHLSTLRRDRRGKYEALQQRLEEILGGIQASSGFKLTLTPEEQGLFALGYYHQRAFDRAQRMEARDRRAQAEAAESAGEAGSGDIVSGPGGPEEAPQE